MEGYSERASWPPLQRTHGQLALKRQHSSRCAQVVGSLERKISSVISEKACCVTESHFRNILDVLADTLLRILDV